MPYFYAKNHPKLLRSAMTKGPENLGGKDREVYALHKSGYIFPI